MSPQQGTGPSLRLARIDLAAIRANVETLRSTTGSAVMAIVKADGYGHGAAQSARAALDGGAEWLGVADISEALELRGDGIHAPVLAWLHGSGADFAAAAEAGVDIGVSSEHQLEQAAAVGGTVQLKTDTGLSRNGIALDECERVFELAARLERAGRIRVRGVFSHLANAGEDADAAQLAEFDRHLALAESVGLEPELRHIASTAGALTMPHSRFDLVRLGIGIYGLSPFAEVPAAKLGLVPAMQLSAEVIGVRRARPQAGVSYGHTYRTSDETNLALVGIGYGDGVPRHASNLAPVTIDGRRYRISGVVAMDQFIVDVGDDRVSVGDRAVLFGDPATGVPSADEWANVCGTINYEIVTRLGRRVRREHIS